MNRRKDFFMPEKPDKILPALYGGLIIGTISGMPVISIVNCFCCAGVLFGGFMSVMFYKNELTAAMSPLTSSDSIQLGAIAGLFGALFGTILHILTLLAMGNVTGDIILDMLHSLNLPPEAMDQIERSMEQSGELTGFSTAISFVTSLVIDPLFGLLGGLIGYSVFKPKQQMMNVQPPPPVQPQS
jgi:predicted DNA repair protein MutK